MLALFSIFLYGALLLLVASVFLAIFFKLLLMTVVVLRSVVGGTVVVVLCVVAAGAGYLLLAPAIRDVAPVFQKPGDGGWGIGADLVMHSATQVLPPLVAATVTCVLIFFTVIRFYPSQEIDVP